MSPCSDKKKEKIQEKVENCFCQTSRFNSMYYFYLLDKKGQTSLTNT